MNFAGFGQYTVESATGDPALSSSPLSSYLAHLRGILADREGAEPTDGQLLERYLSERDEQAFALLVRRHGPMVLGVCRRILGSRHDAEDAFQATFLVLIRRAGCIHPLDRVGGWLHGVAYRTALEARRRRGRRRRQEAQVVPRAPSSEDAAAEWTALLDGELKRLPVTYRLPLLLCDMEGLTRKQAAQRLGWPEGTVSSRLSRGRSLLAGRLKRHGLGLSLAAAAVTEGTATATVPASLVGATVKTAMLMAAGQTAAARLVAANAVSLMEKGLRVMYLSKLKLLAVVVLGIGLLGGLAYHGRGQQPKPPSEPSVKNVVAATPIKAAAKEDDEKEAAVSVKELPPVVVRTAPQAGDTQVDASKVKEIRITFSKKMMDKSWSWVQISKETFPTSDGDVHYDKELRTCVMPVKLEPGKTYVLWLNSERFDNFKDADGRSAVPYLLVFETKPKE
jgi:RNA polymerase sigma factor (sigma-70 family)